jgi:hypothetical protein
MKFKVPYYKQTASLNCGTTALRCILDYFGDCTSIEELCARASIVEGKGVYTIQIATAAKKSGFKVDFYSKHIGYNPEHEKEEFYKKYAELDENYSDKILIDSKRAGVNLFEKVVPLDDFLAFISKDSLAVVLIDLNVVFEGKYGGYQGHFVPLIGYNDENVYVHTLTDRDNENGFSINREVFDRARKAPGTDEDFLVVHRR